MDEEKDTVRREIKKAGRNQTMLALAGRKDVGFFLFTMEMHWRILFKMFLRIYSDSVNNECWRVRTRQKDQLRSLTIVLVRNE